MKVMKVMKGMKVTKAKEEKTEEKLSEKTWLADIIYTHVHTVTTKQ